MARQLSPQEIEEIRMQNQDELTADDGGSSAPQPTQAFSPVGQDRLAESLAMLGPKTTEYGTTNGGPFSEWAAKWFADHIPTVEAKARQYGSNSLAKKGYRFAVAQGRAVNDAEALELGATQYVLEKADRVEDAVLRHDYASDDTWVDAAVYALMILYVRQNGRWL